MNRPSRLLPHPSHLGSALISVLLVLLFTPLALAYEDLTLGVPVDRTLVEGATLEFRVVATATAPLMAMVAGTGAYGGYGVTVHEGAPDGPSVGEWYVGYPYDWDQSVEVATPVAGEYYIAVSNLSAGSRSFTLLVVQRPTVDVALGDTLAGQELWAIGDVRWYRATASGTAPLMVMVVGTGGYGGYGVTVHEGAPDGPAVGEQYVGYPYDWDQSVEVAAPVAGEYYIAVRDLLTGSRSFSLRVEERPVADVALGDALASQELWAIGDVQWYRLMVTDLLLLVVAVNGPNPGSYDLLIHYQSPGELPILVEPEQAGSQKWVQLVEPPDGDYYIEVRRAWSGSASFTISFQGDVRTGTEAAALRVPPVVRPGRDYMLWVEYSNTTDAPQPAPLFVVSSPQSALMRLTEGEPYAPGPLQVLGISLDGTAGVLSPGATYRIPIYFRAPNADEVQFDLAQMVADETTIDWAPIEPEVGPTDMDPAAWAVVWSNLTAQCGGTWADYLQVLDVDATYLAEHGSRTADVRKLFGFELAKASAALSPRPVLAAAVDAYSPGRVLPLAFVRVAPAQLGERSRLGPLGRGWSHNFEYRMDRPDYYRAVLLGPAGRARTFTKYAGAGWQAELGDSGVLTEGSDDSYTLRERDGLLLHFAADGVLDWIEETNGNRLAMTCDASGRLTVVAHSNGQQLTFSYDGSGRIVSLTDPYGDAVQYAYDGDHLTSVTLPGGRTTTYSYGSSGASADALVSVTYPDGTHRYCAYDAQGRLVEQSRDGGAERVQFSYLSPGGVVVTDAAGGASTLHLGASSEVLEVLDPLGGRVSLQYDQGLNLTRVTDAMVGVSELTCDSRGNAQTVSDALGQVISMGHTEELSSLDWLKDGNGNVTDFASDGNGNLSGITYPDASAEGFAYDGAGNLTGVTNRRGQTTTYSYDSLGRVTRKSIAGGRTVDYTCDGRGNLATAADSLTETVAMEYDARDLLTHIEYPGGRWFSFEYDPGGKRTRRTGHDGYVLNYTYDPVGRLSSVTDGTGALLVTYEYDAAGRLSREVKGNGTSTAYGYDPAGQVLSVTNLAPDGTTVQSSFSYTYDANGNPTSVTTLAGTATYGYDAIGQLTSVTYPEGRVVAYAYDAAGNRTSVTDSDAPTTYTSNALNQYTQAGTTTYSYDLDGNMTSRTDAVGTTAYEYDVGNRLVRVVTPSEGTWEYSYDALGNRVAVTHDGVTTWYLHDPPGLIDVAAEYDASGSLLARYVYGLGLAARLDAVGTPAYYAFDAIGHTRQLTDGSGAIVNSYDYDPFGIPLAVSETVASPFGYVGRWGVMADGNGLTYMRARHYDPALGRFMSPDPIGIGGGDLNLYRYVRNSPTVGTDPQGLASLARRIRDLIEQIIRDICLGIADRLGMGGILTGPADVAQGLEREQGMPPAETGRCLAEGIRALTGGRERQVRDLIDAAEGRAPQKERPTVPTKPVGTAAIPIIRPVDPNEKAAPLGYGEGHFIPGGGELTYVIYFENAPTATAPAQEISVTDELSADLDWSTFRLGEIVLGSQVIGGPAGEGDGAITVPLHDSALTVSIVAGLDEGTGEARWALRCIDPLTGELPEDATAGLLPANSPADGRGEGHVTFTVRPRPEASTGTVVSNSAQIVFDVEAPITTAAVSNTLDTGAPATEVMPLPAESCETLEVSWAGEDDAGGSGLRDYTVYVSDNGGSYSAWLNGTTETYALFTGEVGHAYAFYTMGADHVGNVEAAPLEPDATTTVVPGHPIVVSAYAAPTTVASGGQVELSAEATDALGHQIAAWQWTDHGAGGQFSSGSEAEVSYTAPVNTTAADLVVSLEATAKCDGTPYTYGSGTVEVTVFPEGVFPDVPHGFWAFREVWACVHAHIVNGYADGCYHPERPVDRAAMAVYIARALCGGDEFVSDDYDGPSFGDVGQDHWAYRYIEYAAGSDVVQGYQDGTYRPQIVVTRDQMAVYIARALCRGDRFVPEPGVTEPTFTDVPADSWAFRHVEYCRAEGVVQGYADQTYRPQLEVTRDQMAVYVARALGLGD